MKPITIQIPCKCEKNEQKYKFMKNKNKTSTACLIQKFWCNNESTECWKTNTNYICTKKITHSRNLKNLQHREKKMQFENVTYFFKNSNIFLRLNIKQVTTYRELKVTTHSIIITWVFAFFTLKLPVLHRKKTNSSSCKQQEDHSAKNKNCCEKTMLQNEFRQLCANPALPSSKTLLIPVQHQRYIHTQSIIQTILLRESKNKTQTKNNRSS